MMFFLFLLFMSLITLWFSRIIVICWAECKEDVLSGSILRNIPLEPPAWLPRTRALEVTSDGASEETRAQEQNSLEGSIRSK